MNSSFTSSYKKDSVISRCPLTLLFRFISALAGYSLPVKSFRIIAGCPSTHSPPWGDVFNSVGSQFLPIMHSITLDIPLLDYTFHQLLQISFLFLLHSQPLPAICVKAFRIDLDFLRRLYGQLKPRYRHWKRLGQCRLLVFQS